MTYDPVADKRQWIKEFWLIPDQYSKQQQGRLEIKQHLLEI